MDDPRSAPARPSPAALLERMGPWLVLGLAVLTRALLWTEWQRWPGARVAVLDASWHMAFAERVLAGDLDGGRQTWVVAPGQGYLFALARALGGAGTGPAALLLLGFDLLAVDLIRRLGQAAAGPWAGPWAGLLAGLIAALAPNLSFHALGLLCVSPPLTLLALAGLLSLREGRGSAIAAGIALGLSCYIRPNQMLLLPVFALVAAWPTGAPRPFAAGARRATLVALGLTLALIPGLARNFAVSGDLVPVSANGGANLYMAQEPGSFDVQLSPPPGPNNLEWMTEWFQREAEQALGRPLSPAAADGHWRHLAAARIQQDWSGFGQRTAGRLYVALSTWSQHDHYAYDAHRRDQPWLGRLPDPSWVLPGLAILGAWLLWEGGRRREAVLLAGLVLGLAVSLAPFGVVERYRLPGWAGLVPLAASGLVLGLRQPRRLLWAPVLSLLLSADPFSGRLVLPDWMAGGPALSWSEHSGPAREAAEALNVGNALLRQGDQALALQMYEQASRIAPELWEARLNRASLLFSAGRAAEALPLLEALSAERPGAWEPWYLQALAHLEAGDATRAEATLKRAETLGCDPKLVAGARARLVSIASEPHASPPNGIDP